MRDPHTQDPRGFAFVTMDTEAEANAAIDALNGTEILERAIVISKVCFFLCGQKLSGCIV
jgi:transformer-2 protein